MDGFGKEGLREGDRQNHFTTRASMYRKPLKGYRILVAEDNPTNQQVAQAILEGAQIAVTIVNNGEEAVKALENQPFDAVLMDIQMPKMNGYEATRLIREVPRGASIPIVAMTAHAMKGDEEKCLEAGMDGYISKPVNQDRLFHTLWRLLRTRKRSSELIAPEEDEAPVGPGTDRGKGPEDKELQVFGETIENGRRLPAGLPGIDIQQTLAALNMDGPTLTRIMFGFLADNRDTVRKMKEAFAGNDPELMCQLAHGLKGSAANIGAAELSMAAHALEKAYGENFSTDVEPSHFEGLIAKVTSALNQVLESIQSLEEPGLSDTAAKASAEPGFEFDTLLAQLSEAIDRADPEQVMKTMPAVRQQAARCKHIDPFSLKKLEDQVNRYEYDQALETIRRISKNRQEVP
jgi:two-component system sensor histidine kinase/response regulator